MLTTHWRAHSCLGVDSANLLETSRAVAAKPKQASPQHQQAHKQQQQQHAADEPQAGVQRRGFTANAVVAAQPSSTHPLAVLRCPLCDGQFFAQDLERHTNLCLDRVHGIGARGCRDVGARRAHWRRAGSTDADLDMQLLQIHEMELRSQRQLAQTQRQAPPPAKTTTAAGVRVVAIDSLSSVLIVFSLRSRRRRRERQRRKTSIQNCWRRS